MYNVLIVGASRGTGLGLADAFLQRGVQIFAVARRPQGSPGLQALAERAGERLQAVVGDLNQRDCAERIGEALGERWIDRLIINTGIYDPQQQDVAEIDAEQTAQPFLTNAIALLRLARALSGRVSRGGVVAFMSPQMASLALGLSATMSLYGASEAALSSLVRSWEGKLEKLPFSLLLLYPGWVHAEMGGDSAPLSVEENAAGLVAAAEDAAGVNACRFVDYRNQSLPW